MGVITFTDSYTSPIPAPRLFKALILDASNHLPKVVPQFIKSFELIEGNGGPGSITQVNFAEGAPVKYAKQKIDVLDKDSLIYAHTVIEGGELSEKIESITQEAHFESSADGGCINKITVKYHTKADAEITEEEVKIAKAAGEAIFKAVEAYLIANPDA